MKKFIITTTINSPTEAIIKFDNLNEWHLIVVGDKKTPIDYSLQNGLYISPKAKSSEAVLKFWATGKMLYAAYKKNKKKKKKKEKQLTPEITERAAVLASLKKQIATAKVNAQRAATIKAQEKIKESNQ